MNIKINTLLLTLIVSLLAASFFPAHVLAAVGDNCQVDLTSGVSDTQNWSNITILKGSDGYAWRRGTITNPSDALLLKEGETTDISALTGAKAPAQFFIYAANEKTPEVLNKPGEGVCFEGPVADDAGLAVFPINARAVWGDLGKKLVLDVFYQLPQKYDEASGSTTNENSPKESLQLYTFIPPKIVDVKLYTPPSTGSNGSDNPLSNGTQTKPGKWESDRTGSPAGACGQRLSRGFECTEAKVVPLSGFNGSAYTLDPANIDPSLLGSDFDGVGGYPIQIGLLCNGCHTFYARPNPGGNNPGVPFQELRKLTFQSKFLEVIKRLLEGKDLNIPINHLEGVYGAIEQIGQISQKFKIGDITAENLTQNADSNELVKSIKTLLTGDGDRDQAAQSLYTNVDDNLRAKAMMMVTVFILDPEKVKEYILELFPKGGCDWTEDFLNMLVFWTGSTTGNACVLSDIRNMNFYSNITQAQKGDSNWQYIMGASPTLLLNTTDPITLAPDFTDTKIVYSEKEFDSTNSWSFPAGKKQPLNYRYDFVQPFTQKRAGDMCIKKAEISKLASSMQKSYHLTSDEKEVLSQELTSQFPSTSDFVKLSLARPTDIASRISWLGNGKPLSILQLFFQLQPGVCTSESLTPPALTLPVNRDGFEVGIIGH